MIHYGRKWCHFVFKYICGLKVKNLGKSLIKVLLILEGWLSLFTLLSTNTSKQLRSSKRCENTF